MTKVISNIFKRKQAQKQNQSVAENLLPILFETSFAELKKTNERLLNELELLKQKDTDKTELLQLMDKKLTQMESNLKKMNISKQEEDIYGAMR